MIVKLISGSLSLLAFSAAIFAGLWAGNDATTILGRAVSAMVLFLVVGAVLGWMTRTVVVEHITAMEEAENVEAVEEPSAPPAQGQTAAPNS